MPGPFFALYKETRASGCVCVCVLLVHDGDLHSTPREIPYAHTFILGMISQDETKQPELVGWLVCVCLVQNWLN